MSTQAYLDIIGAPIADRLDLFLRTAQRLGAPLANVEKDFWVCWTLNALYHRLPSDGPRLLFKGGTSLSKAFGLINRFSEDIYVTVFRDDLGQGVSPGELAGLSNRLRKAALEAIADACRTYITGDMMTALGEILASDTKDEGRIEIDEKDESGQTLLVWYPRVDTEETGYIQAAVRIESGAKSALDPNTPKTITPYIADELATINLAVADVTTINAERTFWDKIVILQGLRRWFERRGVVRQEGQRISRHYYDLHQIASTELGEAALSNTELGADCVLHARTFFNRPDYDLASAVPGLFALQPTGDMLDALSRDYDNTKAMIFGETPGFDDIVDSIIMIEQRLNRR